MSKVSETIAAVAEWVFKDVDEARLGSIAADEVLPEEQRIVQQEAIVTIRSHTSQENIADQLGALTAASQIFQRKPRQ